ncbi:MAG: extracellular solute-binding protein [Verrucomicrobia bacterium]|nr:extracellular solute-binding protein [Verrucomicrobiota bacterium]
MARTIACLCVMTCVGFITACSESEDLRFPPYDNTEEVQAFWKSKPEFFQWKTPDDLPADLKWENGADVPEFGDPAAKKGGTFHDYHPTYPPTFRFVGPDANNTFRGEHRDNVEIGLITRHLDLDVWIPGMAKEWAISTDRKTVFFRLQDTLTYSDGNPIEVEDFFMTFFVMTSPNLKDPWYNDWYTKEYAGITKYDDKTFAVTIPEPKPDPIWYALLPPAPRHFFREFGPDYPARYQWRICPATGAYVIDPTLLKRGRSITLRRVKDWWARDLKHFRYIFNVDFLDYKIIASQDKAFEMFRQGQLDYFLGGLPRYWYDKAEIPEIYNGYIERHMFYNEFPQVTWGIRLNESKPPLDNLDIRLGINYAMNFQKVIEVDFRGDKTRMQSTFSGFGKFTNPDLRARPYDPALARESFGKAGFTQAGPDGILQNAAGQRLSFTLSTFNSGTITPIMLRLKEEAKKAGLEIKVEGLDATQLYKKLDQKNHELAFAGFGAQPPYPRFWDDYHSDNAFKTGPDGKREIVTDTNNITQTADPLLDPIIDQHRKAETEEEVQQLSWQLAKLVEDRACTIPAWESPFYRYLCWRWVQWPKTGNARQSREPLDAHMFWIDPDMKKETKEATDNGRSFGEVLRVFDTYRRDK